MEPWILRVQPRPWQEQALAAWKHDLRGVVSVVTGGGKTIFAEMCMAFFRKQRLSPRFLIVVPTITLLDQWFVSLVEDLGVPKEDIACFSSQEKSKTIKPVNLMVINTARKAAVRIAKGSELCLIVDECHRAGSPINAAALEVPHIAALGLSATPEREYDEGFKRYVQPVLGQIIYRYEYNQARAEGVISPFELINVKIKLLPDESDAYDAFSKRIAVESNRLQRHGGSDDRLKQLLLRRAAISASAAMRIPVAAKLAERASGKRTIIFHERVSAANALFSVLKQRKHSVTIYHSQIGPMIRRDNLRLYRQGVFDSLVCCRALDEGMNVPETAVAIVASASASYRQRIQRLGRVLRPAPGKTMATIYTIYATDQEEARLREEAAGLKNAEAIHWYRGTRPEDG
jgi:superfamily II DNA or RNA helicase